MKKIVTILSILAIVVSVISISTLNGSIVKAATIGERLIAPEEGWIRFDENDPAIKYSPEYSTWTRLGSTSGVYKSVPRYTNKADATVRFDFTGTKIRIIQRTNIDNKKAHVTIDGVEETFGPFKNQFQTLVYEKTGLENKRHTVVITWSGSGYSNTPDAIDIDENGELLDPSETPETPETPEEPDNVLVESLKLNKETLELDKGTSEALITSVLPEAAANKNIKWTSSDSEIASVDDSGNVIAKSPGKVTITAETTDGSNLKATAEVTVKEEEVDNSKGILKLTTTTGDLHEYDLTKKEIEKFISWLNIKGEDKPYYEFKLNVTTGNIDLRTEYIMYDEIVSFVVDEY